MVITDYRVQSVLRTYTRQLQRSKLAGKPGLESSESKARAEKVSISDEGRRRLVMEQLAPRLGVAVQERELAVADIIAADELFYCNSLQGIRPVASLGDRRWRQHATCEALHRCLLEALS